MNFKIVAFRICDGVLAENIAAPRGCLANRPLRLPNEVFAQKYKNQGVYDLTKIYQNMHDNGAVAGVTVSLDTKIGPRDPEEARKQCCGVT